MGEEDGVKSGGVREGEKVGNGKGESDGERDRVEQVRKELGFGRVGEGVPSGEGES